MSASRVISRLSTHHFPSLSLKSFNGKSVTSLLSPMKPVSHSTASASARRISAGARLPVELSCCLGSMMPLHSAIASARLKSILSADSQSWGLIPQGISSPL